MALYSNVIRDRFRHPRFRGEVVEPDAVFEDVNPLCGDRIRIGCRVTDGRLVDARFTGDSCAIAAAAADVLIELARGQAVEQVQGIAVADVVERLEADIPRVRLKCVALPVGVLNAALEGHAAPSAGGESRGGER
jgi:nitrogen fixation NifU-like protein